MNDILITLLQKPTPIKDCGLVNCAVASKDTLLGLLRDAEPEKLAEIGRFIITALVIHEGLWAETSYCYKAAEIAQQVADRATALSNEISLETGRKRRGRRPTKLLSLRLDAEQVAQRFRSMQADLMNAGI